MVERESPRAAKTQAIADCQMPIGD